MNVVIVRSDSVSRVGFIKFAIERAEFHVRRCTEVVRLYSRDPRLSVAFCYHSVLAVKAYSNGLTALQLYLNRNTLKWRV